MTLPSGDKRVNEDTSNTVDSVQRTFIYKGTFGKNSVTGDNNTNTAMGINQETTFVKRNDGKKAVCVDDIISGVETCKISNDSSKDHALTELLRNMKLEDIKTIKKPVERKSQPKQDDERDVSPKSDRTVKPDNLVKLEAPSADDQEEPEEYAQSTSEDAENTLGERGPMLGVPANYNTELGHNYIASKSCKPYQIQSDTNYSAALPVNFPDYSYQNMRTTQVKGSKREMDEREIYHEPQKWVRPQNTGMMEINNLNAPWNVPSSGVASANGKTVSQVYQKQMSGGTVYTSEDALFPDDQIFNGNLDNQEFQDLFELGLDEAGYNIPVETDDFLPSSGLPSLNAISVVGQGIVSQANQMSNEMSVGLHHQQQWHNLQNSLPPASQFTNSFGHNFQQQKFENCYQQTLQQRQDAGHGKRGSLGNDDYSDGYASDLSPSHEMQSSPMSSPHSVMDGSPAAFNGSPPRTNWSPPPSNMSYSSVDSGVCSPMTEDLNGYTSMKSPRQGHSMSPQSMTSVPATAHQSKTPPLTSPPRQVVPATGEAYVSDYITTHLADLDCALEVASQDLMAEKLRKGYRVAPPQSATSAPVNAMNNRNVVMDCNRIGIYNANVGVRHQNVAVAAPVGIKKPNITPSSCAIINPVINGKPQNIPNLPTTVPTTISLVNKITGMGQTTTTNGINQAKDSIAPINSNSNAVKVPQMSNPGAFILTPTANNNSQPQVNNQGKIAIAPINQKPKTAEGQNQILPVFVTTSGTVTPVFIVPPSIPPKTPPRTLRTLAPKEPAKQKEKTTEINTKPANVGNPPGAGSRTSQGEKSTNVSSPNGKKQPGSSVEKLLNLARRLVAEMSTNDLKYRDEDGDTYLHVAVCKADKFMVQALLERLVREKLTEMIDMQNLQGQTPLYLAVSTNNAEMVQLLIEQGADVNPFAETVTSAGYVEKTAAIHCASTKGEKYLETLKALFKAPEINLNQVNSDGHTALNCAILAHGKMNTDRTPVNSIPIMRTLIHAGADLNLQVQQSGKTALMYALESRDLDLIESTFQLVEPQKLPVFLKTQAFDSSSCLRIAESLKATLDQAGQQRLLNCLRPGNSRGVFGQSS